MVSTMVDFSWEGITIALIASAFTEVAFSFIYLFIFFFFTRFWRNVVTFYALLHEQ